MKKKLLLSLATLFVVVVAAGVYLLFNRTPKTSLAYHGMSITAVGMPVTIVPTSEAKQTILKKISALSESFGATVDITHVDGSGGPLPQPLTITFNVENHGSALREASQHPDSVYIARYDETRKIWVRLPSSYNDRTHELSAKTYHLSTFDARTEAAAREFAEAKIQEMIEEVEESGKGYRNGLDGGYVIVDGEVNLASAGEDFATAYEIPTEIRNTWGCNPDPGDGTKEKKLERPFDTTQVAESTLSIESQTGGDELQVLLRVLGVWNFGFGRQTALVGAIKNQEDKPVKKANVRLENVRTGEVFEEKSGDDGRYEVKVPSGMYRVSLTKKNCDPKTYSQLICGWGEVLSESQRTEEFNLDMTTTCTQKATGGYSGTVPVTLTTRVPNTPPFSFQQAHDVTVELTHVQPKKDGLFWEGDWEGTMTLLVRQNLDDFNKILQGTGQITRDDVNTQEFSLKLHLEVGPNGQGLSSASFFEGKALTNVTVDAAGVVMGQPFSKQSAVGNAGQSGRGTVLLDSQEEDKITIRLKQTPPFDNPPPMPYVDFAISSFPVITLERAPEE